MFAIHESQNNNRFNNMPKNTNKCNQMSIQLPNNNKRVQQHTNTQNMTGRRI